MNVAVLGAGENGRVVATLAARSGYDVRMHSHDATLVMDSVDVIERQLADDSGDESPPAAEVLDRLEPTTDLERAVTDAAVVVETTLDTTETLQERFAELETLVDRETLTMSSVPTVSITAGGAGLRHPDRAFGLYVRETSDRPLVELAVADQTAGTMLEDARSFVAGLEATAVTVRDSPGAATARPALAAEVEAMRMVQNGIASVEAADTALAAEFDLDVGPLERADRAGLDGRQSTLETLGKDLGSRFDPPAILADLVADGTTGVDAGEGFYVWDGDEPTGSALPDPTVPGRDRGRDDPEGREP